MRTTTIFAETHTSERANHVAYRLVYMVLTDSRSGSYDVTDDVITYNHCRNFGATYLGNDAR